jgi:5-formyltetrahydrofolate cyclo-ligase
VPSWSFSLLNKAQIRQAMRKRRHVVGVNERQAAAEAAASILVCHPLFTESAHIACYFPVAEEFDSVPIIQAIWQAGKTCYLPLVLKPKKELGFAVYQENQSLNPNCYQVVPASQLDLVILPLIAFDVLGYRLGSGGGYYDATFSSSSSSAKPSLLGLGYQLQEVPKLPHDTWDIPLAGVLTEQKIVLFR